MVCQQNIGGPETRTAGKRKKTITILSIEGREEMEGREEGGRDGGWGEDVLVAGLEVDSTDIFSVPKA